MTDLERLARALGGIEAEAARLPWAEKRPWRVDSHLSARGGVPTVDLHDLDRRCAIAATRAACALGPELEAGALRLVTGRGTHSLGAGPVLLHAVRKELGAVAAETRWRVRPAAGGWVVVVDPRKAPRAATGELGPLFYLLAAAFGAAAVVALARALGAL